jgi:hypothetical protein
MTKTAEHVAAIPPYDTSLYSEKWCTTGAFGVNVPSSMTLRS